MPNTDVTETMLNFARLTGTPLVKEAWTWRDIVTELGIGAAIDVGVVGGAAALTGVGLSVPIVGWAVLGGAALTMGIWYLTRQMDDNITDLIDRLEDLDPNDNYTNKLNQWVSTLKSFKPIFAAAPTTTDQNERAQGVMQKYIAMKQASTFIDQMWQEWPDMKENMTDWFFDDGQAEHALQLTNQTIKNSLAETKKKAQEEATKVVDKYKQTSGVDYRGLATSISGLYVKLTDLAGGKPPTFDTDAEHGAWAMTQRVLGKAENVSTITQQELAAIQKPMQDLKSLMEQGIKQLQNKSALHRPAISKRALTLGDGTKVTPPGVKPPDAKTTNKTKGKPGKGKTKQKTRAKGDPVVRGLQAVVNQINTALNSGSGVVREDGVYGPVTADAVVGAMSSDWRIQRAVTDNAKVGFKALEDIEMMKSRPQLLKMVYRVLAPIARNLNQQVERGAGKAGLGQPRQLSQRQVAPGKAKRQKEQPIKDEELLTYRLLHDW